MTCVCGHPHRTDDPDECTVCACPRFEERDDGPSPDLAEARRLLAEAHGWIEDVEATWTPETDNKFHPRAGCEVCSFLARTADGAERGRQEAGTDDVIRAYGPRSTHSPGRYVAEGWWHPNVKDGQVHDHSQKNPSAYHRLCEQVYTMRSEA